MKKIAIALMVVGVIVIGLGTANWMSSEAQKYCEEFRLKALTLAEQAVAAQGTPQEQELMDASEGESAMADVQCDTADERRQEFAMIAGGGLLLLVVGFVLSRRKGASPPVA